MQRRHLFAIVLSLFVCMVLITLRSPSTGQRRFDFPGGRVPGSEVATSSDVSTAVEPQSPPQDLRGAGRAKSPELVEAEQLLQRLREIKEASMASQMHDRPPSRGINDFESPTKDDALARLLDSVLTNANALQAEQVPDRVVVVDRPVIVQQKQQAAPQLPPNEGGPVQARPNPLGIGSHIAPAPVESFPAQYNEGSPLDRKDVVKGGAAMEWGTQFSEPVGHDESNPYLTTYKCYRSVDWAEICIYKNLCHDGNMVVFFDDSKADNKTLIPRCVHPMCPCVVHARTCSGYTREPGTTLCCHLLTATLLLCLSYCNIPAVTFLGIP
jgi:hypothetical protein